MENIENKLIRYVKIDTMSMENTNVTPSTKKQFNLARILASELTVLGLENIKISDNCILTAELKSNCNSKLNIGFIAHLDTIPGVSGKDVKPNIVENYDGKPIKLKNNIIISEENFPFMKSLLGKTLVTTDGTTVLGADDKAGIAIIMSMLEYFKENETIPHVNIHVAFTPDEEIGGGIDSFNVKDFNCDYAYTVDGGAFNEINYENFNAESAIVNVKGLDIHPGSAKGKMINASLLAMEFHSLLPVFDNPMYTDNYEGFNHLMEMKGEVGNATLHYILRNHDKKLLEKQKNDFYNAKDFMNKKYDGEFITVEIKHSYSNMAEILKKDMRSVDRAKQAIKEAGFEPITSPIRGGTDGAKLTQMGLNTPNLGTGGYNCHGQYEFACVEEMENVRKILINIAKE